ncbi:DNA translocase FtsK [Nitrosomonas sp. PY1]|uniref:DNA translocase FtsK n=1 Tax=Nitrosomonas sp. PY1 TaxID=1803906 RepID=UPI001FC851FA|nr:DNA translocase FtsK [Nitrosomonas sp. PY1]GKS69263.1 DNA translocase FtsK [Nitrosomonas sp. PY1]
MSLINKPMARKSASHAFSPKVARLLRESFYLLLVGIALYLIMILVSYDRGDAGWSHSGAFDEIQNTGGYAGAWLADLLLYLFGVSAWWWIAFFLSMIAWSYRRIDSGGIFDKQSIMFSIGGFLLLLIASSGLESLRFYTINASLPLAPGGILGNAISYFFSKVFGAVGATLLLLTLIAVGFSQFTGLSWVRFVEKIGEQIEELFFFIINKWETRRDKLAGMLAARVRDELVENEKKRIEETPSLHIELPTSAIAKSQRIIKEKQASLFSDLPDSSLPPLHLLDEPEKDFEVLSKEALEFTSRLIERKLKEFGVDVKVVAAFPGPVITRYEIEPAVGVKGSQVINLVKDLARALSVASIRVVETIPGKTSMGLELPNPKRQIVRLQEILGSQAYADSASPLTIALGKDISGRAIVSDLAKMPHALVAGTTGSGKSVAINAVILSLVYKATPEQVRLILIDPKMLELSVYEGISHLLTPVVTDMREAASALRWCVSEMERRYKLMSALGVRNLSGYNQKIKDAAKGETPVINPLLGPDEAPEYLDELPMIVVVIDELADLMMVAGKKVEQLIARLAQKARASGIHLLLATQRPSVDVITGLIKANIPTRIAFQVSSKIDSRTILDQMGAEALLGQGDMLYLPPGSGYTQRVHGAFVADHEVHKVVEYLKEHGEPCYIEEILQTDDEENEMSGILEAKKSSEGESDPLYDEAVAIVIKTRRASISLVQRNLRIGYNRAARLIEEMERTGLVSAMQSNGNREVLAPSRSE